MYYKTFFVGNNDYLLQLLSLFLADLDTEPGFQFVIYPKKFRTPALKGFIISKDGLVPITPAQHSRALFGYNSKPIFTITENEAIIEYSSDSDLETLVRMKDLVDVANEIVEWFEKDIEEWEKDSSFDESSVFNEQIESFYQTLKEELLAKESPRFRTKSVKNWLDGKESEEDTKESESEEEEDTKNRKRRRV